MPNPYYTKPYLDVGQYSRTSPIWSGTPQHQPKVLVPGGGHLNGDTFGGIKTIDDGILVSRTYAERDAGIGYSPYTVGDDEVHLLFFTVHDVTKDNECELYMAKSNNVVYENLIPNWTTLSTEIKTFIRTNYVCLVGVV